MDTEDGQVEVKLNGIDIFDPSKGEVRSDEIDGIACWFIDTTTTKRVSSCGMPISWGKRPLWFSQEDFKSRN